MSALKLSLAARRIGMATLIAASFAVGPASADQGFRSWISSFRSVAAKSGVSGATYDRAFAGVTEPDREVLEKARFQPEFTAPVWDYFDNRVQEDSIANGQAMARKWKPWLDKIEFGTKLTSALRQLLHTPSGLASPDDATLAPGSSFRSP